ncbi:hypothetical protein F5Y08DRAFT_174280 [Xylaria arbuscula]|nr:hypothetical protein F5Y08DRAFT_174280 [Xylaria arbuscula]
MASFVVGETFHRVATQPGSVAKTWDREELIKCRAIGTRIASKADLEGEIHPIFNNWVGVNSELYRELEQSMLLASRLIEANGLSWLSDFLVDDIFDEDYPGREHGNSFVSNLASEKNSVCPHSIVRHDRAYRATRANRSSWRATAQKCLRNELPSLIQWQIDEDIFHERGWIGYTCRHPRNDLPLSEIDKYETIRRFDDVCSHQGSRNLTVLITAEYPTRLAQLRRQGKAQGEEYLLTAFMATVTMLHEIGHAIYWKDRRSLTRDLRESFYGADLEMELGDSFVASIFGGWIPVPVRELRRLREDFSFVDGLAWRQALTWDYHRMRPKYRAHYSISMDYIARLFSEASWSMLPTKVTEFIRPRYLTGNSIALRTVGLYAPLTQSNRHATAAIADFHCRGDGWAWNRRPGAWFRIPQYEGCMYPELELPRAGEETICPPMATVTRSSVTARDCLSYTSSVLAGRDQDGKKAINPCTRKATDRRPETATGIDVRVRGGHGLSPIWPVPRKSEYSPRKLARGNPTTRVSRPAPRESSSGLEHAMGFKIPRKQDSAGSWPLARNRVSVDELHRDQRPSQERRQGQRQQQQQYARVILPVQPRPLRRVCYDQGNEEYRGMPCRSSGISDSSVNDNSDDDEHEEAGDDAGGRDCGEISVDELKKRLSQLIGLSLTELEKLLDGSQCRATTTTTTAAGAVGVE